ncbi:hypothetical protein BpHYR1_021598 [Brachionus plicatilis]|uniref:Uncharacterized protein n=1 Tax=Brachionus plicatilis TaxID=10195 RepID=A0A3M7P3W7_BRAPC|nr:hypothetical protein BpHYR1_021598 [Brachionus plicatilis]
MIKVYPDTESTNTTSSENTETSSEDTETETCEEPKRPTRSIFHSESMKQQSFNWLSRKVTEKKN